MTASHLPFLLLLLSSSQQHASYGVNAEQHFRSRFHHAGEKVVESPHGGSARSSCKRLFGGEEA